MDIELLWPPFVSVVSPLSFFCSLTVLSEKPWAAAAIT
jgi:hypothetical protein